MTNVYRVLSNFLKEGCVYKQVESVLFCFGLVFFFCILKFAQDVLLY